MNLIKPLLLSSMLIASLSACSPQTEPKPENENTTAQTDETVPEDEFKPTMAEYDPNDPRDPSCAGRTTGRI